VVGLEAESQERARPTGSLLFADPSTAEMTRNIHPFNDPHSRGYTEGADAHGINSVTARDSIYRKPRWYENKSSEDSEDVDG
jgi:hypothetical protein